MSQHDQHDADGDTRQEQYIMTVMVAIQRQEDVAVLEIDGPEGTLHVGAVMVDPSRSDGSDELFVYPCKERRADESRVKMQAEEVKQLIRREWPNVSVIPYDRSSFA